MRVARKGLLLLTAGLFIYHASAKEVETEFKIVPGKAGNVEVALDTPPIPSSTCRFEWDSSGATVEVSLASFHRLKQSLKVYADQQLLTYIHFKLKSTTDRVRWLFLRQ